jgi:putative nucleotidyltransferase with HDIG domain
MAASIQGFRAIPLSTIRMDSVTEFDIHIQTTPGQPPVLYRERRLPVTPAVIAQLGEQRHRHVYIPAEQEKEYRRYLTSHIESILEDPGLPLSEKCEVLYDSAQSLVADILEDTGSRELMIRSKELVACTVDFMTRERHAFQYLIQLVSYDYYTYTHSVNVSIFSVALAQRLGDFDSVALRDLGEGTLLHDIGKSAIAPSISLHRGPLSDEQYRTMKMHPVYGHEILSEHELVSATVLDIVRHHHEKLDGSGYPDGLSGDRISPLVRISTIADIFDAMTTRRCYRDAMGSFDALRDMKEYMSNQLDQVYFRSFVEMMGGAQS